MILTGTPARDYLLSLHQTGQYTFELSGLNSGSIRDQMVRARLLVDRLAGIEMIGPKRELLVIGGGAAGATAALAARRKGIDVTLIEKEDFVFARQRGVDRWLDPVEYDWPQDHWQQRMVPSPELPYSADSGANLAVLWEQEVHKELVRSATSKFELITGVDARELSFLTMPRGLGVTPWDGDPLAVRVFGAAISCVGMSAERVALAAPSPAYAGPEFWANDTLEDPHLGLTRAAGTKVRVLVSGGGDGAQQDLLRILTGSFGARLAAKIGLADFRGFDLRDVLTAEDYARRSRAWGDETTDFTVSDAKLDAAYTRLAQDVLHQHGTAARSLLRSDVSVRWVLGGRSISPSYGLNRLLSIVFVMLHSSQEGQAVAILGKVASIVPSTGHSPPVCGSCFGQPHDVDLIPWGSSTATSLGTFDAIVLRHGIVQRPLFDLAPVRNQTVPFQGPD